MTRFVVSRPAGPVGLAWVACLLVATATAARAQTQAVETAKTAQVALTSTPATADDPACIEVEVNGVRAPSFDCLSIRLRPPAGNAAAGRPGATAPLAAEAIAQRPGNQLGLFNRAATANRMGNTFGTSVLPQRPPPPAPPTPPATRPHFP